MTFAWTNEMKNASRDPKLEQMARGAIVAACLFADASTDTAPPRFDGGTFMRPMSVAATAMAAACMKGVKTSSAVESAMILTNAVGCMRTFWKAGRGDAGWAAVVALFTPHMAKVGVKPGDVVP